MGDPDPQKSEAKDGLVSLLSLLTATRKRDLKAIARSVVISGSDFATFILACESGITPWRHQISHRQFVPKHLDLTDHDLKAMASNGIGKLKPDAAKAFTKVTQTFRDRRLLVGHIFYNADLSNWHLIYFDQRDVDRRSRHWEHGPHVHLINHLWPHHTAQKIWEDFNSGNVAMSGALHIRFHDPRI